MCSRGLGILSRRQRTANHFTDEAARRAGQVRPNVLCDPGGGEFAPVGARPDLELIYDGVQRVASIRRCCC
jgi:hypothetical protein